MPCIRAYYAVFPLGQGRQVGCRLLLSVASHIGIVSGGVLAEIDANIVGVNPSVELI